MSLTLASLVDCALHDYPMQHQHVGNMVCVSLIVMLHSGLYSCILE